MKSSIKATYLAALAAMAMGMDALPEEKPQTQFCVKGVKGNPKKLKRKKKGNYFVHYKPKKRRQG